MQSKTETSSVNIKQRIIGAVVLIALAVILIPMVLDLRKDYDHIIRGSNIPPKPDDFRIEVFDFSARPEVQVVIKRVDKLVSMDNEQTLPPVDAIESHILAAATTAKSRIAELRKRSDSSKKGLRGKAGQPVAESWVVQLASLSRLQNAEVLRDRVRKKGLRAFITTKLVAGQPMYRVMVGPELLRSNAEKQRVHLLEVINLSGMVVKYQR